MFSTESGFDLILFTCKYLYKYSMFDMKIQLVTCQGMKSGTRYTTVQPVCRSHITA